MRGWVLRTSEENLSNVTYRALDYKVCLHTAENHQPSRLSFKTPSPPDSARPLLLCSHGPPLHLCHPLLSSAPSPLPHRRGCFKKHSTFRIRPPYHEVTAPLRSEAHTYRDEREGAFKSWRQRITSTLDLMFLQWLVRKRA